jgi:hypothetical protein
MHRSQLIERVHRHLEERDWPRFMLFLMIAAAGFAGFIVSYGLLGAGMDSMALRYAVAGTTGYAAFLALLGVYVIWKRGGGEVEGDLFDAASEFDVRFPGSSSTPTYFSGGQSGGGGASSSWGSGSSGSSGGSSWFDGDVDFGWVLLVLAAAAAALLAVTYIVWTAPALLAEVLVDAVIVSAVSKRLGSIERRDWTATAIRQTWLPAAIMIGTLAVAGWALQKAAPETKSIGPAVQAILE